MVCKLISFRFLSRITAKIKFMFELPLIFTEMIIPQTSEDENEWIWIISRIWTIERHLGVDEFLNGLEYGAKYMGPPKSRPVL